MTLVSNKRLKWLVGSFSSLRIGDPIALIYPDPQTWVWDLHVVVFDCGVLPRSLISQNSLIDMEMHDLQGFLFCIAMTANMDASCVQVMEHVVPMSDTVHPHTRHRPMSK